VPSGAIRIVVLGGSSTAGTGWNLPDVQTWPWKVHERLSKELSNQTGQFINAAVGGYSSFESLGRLWSRIRFLKPDILVVNHGWNEMYYFSSVNELFERHTLPDGSWSLDVNSQPVTIYEPLWLDRFFRPSQLLTRVRFKFSTMISGEVGGTASETLATSCDRRSVDVWRMNLRLIRETASLMGAKLFIAKQATLVVPELPASERARCRYKFHGFDHDAHVRAFSDIYRVIDDEIPQGSIVDLTVLSGQPEYFNDHVHPTPKGTTAIARIVATHLVNYLRGKTGILAEESK
jgi:hypothetical protein